MTVKNVYGGMWERHINDIEWDFCTSDSSGLAMAIGDLTSKDNFPARL